MKKIILLFVIIIGIFSNFNVVGQTNIDGTNLAQASNFSLPSSIVFNLLDINPSKVNRPGFTNDFKFDWIIKDYKIVPNMAIETQPAWLFCYNNTNYDDYLRLNWWERILSSFTVSIGTANKDSISTLAWGLKFNLYAEKDPVFDTNYTYTIGNFIANKSIKNKIDSLQFEFDNIKINSNYHILPITITNIDSIKMELILQISKYQSKYSVDSAKYFSNIDIYKEEYKKENWNKSIIDCGFGQLFNYFGQSIDTLSFQNKGIGIWVSGCFGIGRSFLLNGIIKYSNTSMNDITTIGANLRYGGLNSNFFIESLFNITTIESYKKITISYGGEIKIQNSITLQFGIKTDYTKSFKFENLIPIVNLNYLTGNN